MENFTDFD